VGRTVRFKCRTCGKEGKVEILTQEEIADLERPRQPVRCPNCGSQDVEIG